MASHYDVYGIGNALVDIVAQVSDDFLKQNKVDKGLMTLITKSRQEELLAAITRQEFKRACGGSAANTMIVLSQLGGSSFYSCKVASDEWGDFYLQDMQKNGVASNVGAKRDSGDTGKCMVMVTPDAQRSMNTYLGITENFSFNEIVEEELKKAEYLYIEGYLVASPTAREAAVRSYDIAKRYGVKTALTFSDPNMVQFFREGMNEIIHNGVDLLFCNEEEAKTYAQVDDIEVAIQRIHQIAKVAVITLGEKGALVSENGTQYRIDGRQVNAVDTNGAGDIFAGTFLYAITQGMNYEQAGQLSCRIAEQLVQSVGPRLEKEIVVKIKDDFC